VHVEGDDAAYEQEDTQWYHNTTGIAIKPWDKTQLPQTGDVQRQPTGGNVNIK
jgi:hypothetical protein